MLKRITLSIASLCVLLNASAKEVSSDMASNKATEIMSSINMNFSGKISKVSPVTLNGQKAYYIVQFAPQGWALISADDTTEPLIGYSTTGTYVLDNQPESMKALLNCFAERINDRKHVVVKQVAGWETGSQLYTHSMTRAAKEDVEPLIQVNWNQTGSYLKYCPKSNSAGQAIVGCVAVGMAQAMSVARWPEHANGEYSYTDPTYGTQYINYDEEPAYNWDAIISGANGKDDVARLLWHCGVSVNMQYGANGSGTQDSYIAKALPRNFGYPSSVKYVKRSSYDGDWEALVYQELSEGRAVCLSGQDIKGGYGHCFNLDGYAGGAYHVNWGWGGANNGYFMLNGLKDATMNMDYSAAAYQSLIIGIRRPSDKPSDITLSNNTVSADAPIGSVIGDIVVVNEAQTPPTYTFVLKGTYNPITHRYNSVPFDVVDGKLVTTKKLTTGSKTFSITATDANGNSVTRSFTVTIGSTSGIQEIVDNTQIVATSYYNLQGVKLQSSQKGINVIEYKLADGSKRIIKQVIR